MSLIIIPRVAFLGVCEQGAYFPSDNPFTAYHNLIGLTTTVAGYIYPLDLSSRQCVFAVYNLAAGEVGHISIRNLRGEELFGVDIKSSLRPITEPGAVAASAASEHPAAAMPSMPGWHTILAPMKDVLVPEPQILSVHYSEEGTEYSLGHMLLGLVEVPLPTPERIAALRSDPRSIKSAVVHLGCRHCASHLAIYTAIEKKDRPPHEATWYQDVQDEFTCSCGSTRFPLKYIRQNMHALLGLHAAPFENVTLTSMYENQALQKISTEFLSLLEKDTSEEEVQKHLGAATVLFHPWSPQRIFTKPPVLSKYKADFAILDTKKTLHLVEIERVSLPLLRKNGDSSAELNHAISQVQTWLYEFSQHQAAVLDGIGLLPADVTRVRGVVIAGRNLGHDAKHLQQLKWQDRGPIDFLTYDDLLLGLTSLIAEIRKI